MFGLLKKDPIKQLEAEHKALLTAAFEAQRKGDIESYAFLTADAEKVHAKMATLKAGRVSPGH